MADAEPPPRRLNAAFRLILAREARRWHWISSAVCLVLLMMFAATGVTLNHSAIFEPEPRVETTTLAAPAPVRAALAAGPAEAEAPLPAAAVAWLRTSTGVRAKAAAAEWTPEAVTLVLSQPGRETVISLDRASGAATVATSRRGLVGALNDLHTGRYTPRAWNGLIDVFAIACLVFALTGLTLLALGAKGRRLTWPLVGAGLAVPLLLYLLASHLG